MRSRSGSTAATMSSVSFEDASDDVVARAARALYFFAARLDDLIAGQEVDLFPMLRHILLAPAVRRPSKADVAG